MKILFINGSPNKNGNTVALAKKAVASREYKSLHLVDYKVYGYGQNFANDQFADVVEAMKDADVILIGSPVYWHNMSGMVRNFLDRFYGVLREGELSGQKMGFLFQGAAPEAWMLEKAEYTMKRFAKIYGMEYIGMAVSGIEAETLGDKF